MRVETKKLSSLPLTDDFVGGSRVMAFIFLWVAFIAVATVLEPSACFAFPLILY